MGLPSQVHYDTFDMLSFWGNVTLVNGERTAADVWGTGLCFPGAVTSDPVKSNGFQAADGLAPDKDDSRQWATAALASLF